MHPFIQGVSYDREDVLGFIGSRQSQSGIVHSSVQDDYIAVFSGGRYAKRVGYQDGWDSDGTFRYHGQGAKGSQKFARGNKVLAEHRGVVLLFETWKPKKSWKGRQRFIGNYMVSGYAWEDGQGTRKGDRVLVFSLVPIAAASLSASETSSRKQDGGKQMSALRANAIMASRPSTPSYCTSQQFRVRSEIVAEYVTARADGVCEACGAEAPFERPDGSPFLEIHHTRRLADDGPDDIMHVAAICPNCHREAHFGSDRTGFRDRLEKAIADREEAAPQLGTAGLAHQHMDGGDRQHQTGGSNVPG